MNIHHVKSCGGHPATVVLLWEQNRAWKWVIDSLNSCFCVRVNKWQRINWDGFVFVDILINWTSNQKTEGYFGSTGWPSLVSSPLGWTILNLLSLFLSLSHLYSLDFCLKFNTNLSGLSSPTKEGLPFAATSALVICTSLWVRAGTRLVAFVSVSVVGEFENY